MSRRRAAGLRGELADAAARLGVASPRQARDAATMRGPMAADGLGRPLVGTWTCRCPDGWLRRAAEPAGGLVNVSAAAGIVALVAAMVADSVVLFAVGFAAAGGVGAGTATLAAAGQARRRPHRRACWERTTLRHAIAYAADTFAGDGFAAAQPEWCQRRHPDVVGLAGQLTAELLRRHGVDPDDHARLAGGWHGDAEELLGTLAALRRVDGAASTRASGGGAADAGRGWCAVGGAGGAG